MTSKPEFIEALAEYLVGDQVKKSTALGLAIPGSPAMEWANIRKTTPLFGYPTLEEAIETLTEFLD